MHSFASDNHSGIHPSILQAMIDSNHGHAPAYGNDQETEKAIALFKQHFGESIEVYFTYNGTGANVSALSSITSPYSAVIASEHAHIHVNECAALERFAGCKILTIPSVDGKINPEQIKQHLQGIGDPHHVQPKIISLTQVTELGTCYTIAELKALTKFAHEQDLLVHVDGARIANAAAFLNCDLRNITSDVGIDVLSFGGTKNGMMVGEAVIFFNPELARNFQYVRKQACQLHSKMRFIATQFIALLSHNLWRNNAEHSNAMARYLAENLANIPGLHLTQALESNAVFLTMPAKIIAPLQAYAPFYVWNEAKHEVRLVCSFDTTQADIDQFLIQLKNLL